MALVIGVYKRPADFYGRANFVEGTVRDRQDGHLVFDSLGTTLTVPAAETVVEPGDSAIMVVRPEMVEIDSPDAHVEGIVRRSAYLGHMIEYEVEVGGQLLSLVENDPRRDVIHSEGQPVRVRFLEECLYILPK